MSSLILLFEYTIERPVVQFMFIIKSNDTRCMSNVLVRLQNLPSYKPFTIREEIFLTLFKIVLVLYDCMFCKIMIHQTCQINI